MNAFTVEWDPEAENQLAALWVIANDRKAVTQAQAEADRLLAQDPVACGTERSEGLYHLRVPPLDVFYSVDPARRIVQVEGVAFSP
jgi:hypothetical protein